MRLTLDAGWLHLDLSFGPPEVEDAEVEYTPADAILDTNTVIAEQADEHGELDSRRILGFRGR